MAAQGIAQYCNLMEDIKGRLVSVDVLGGPAGATIPPVVRFESIYLQYRKMLEILAFASLVSDAAAHEDVYQQYAKERNPAKLLEMLEKANPAFWPKPKTGAGNNPAERTEGVLTRDGFIELHQRASVFVYQRDPFVGAPDFNWYLDNIERWRDRIVGLLDVHVIHLAGLPSPHLIRMQGEGGRVSSYPFAR